LKTEQETTASSPASNRKKAQSRAPLVALLALVALVLVGIACWQLWGEPGKLREADRAIDAAEAACAQGGRAEFDHRMVEARTAIGELDGEDSPIYQAKLDNRLLLIGCRP
jgi:hypothetical protein